MPDLISNISNRRPNGKAYEWTWFLRATLGASINFALFDNIFLHILVTLINDVAEIFKNIYQLRKTFFFSLLFSKYGIPWSFSLDMKMFIILNYLWNWNNVLFIYV